MLPAQRRRLRHTEAGRLVVGVKTPVAWRLQTYPSGDDGVKRRVRFRGYETIRSVAGWGL